MGDEEEASGASVAETAAASLPDDDDPGPSTATETTTTTTTTAEEATSEEEKKDEAAAPKKKADYTNWPLQDIREPHPNDVLFGRGGGTNHHPGNKLYRKMVEDRKVDYINSKRLDKPLVALGIIKEWRGQEPPGRFLKVDDRTGYWNDVGDKKAREKTSQALREKAPILRKQQEEELTSQERKERGLPEESEEEESLPLKEADGVSRPFMARDTTFGVEYIDPNKEVTLEGFSWQDGIGDSQRAMPPHTAPPPGEYAASSREGSYSNVPPPPPGVSYRYGSHGTIVMPPPSGSFSTPAVSTDERHLQYVSSGRYESWGVPAPPPPGAYGRPVGSWSEREHSLGQFALPHASVGHPASYATFDPRGAPPGSYPGHGAPPGAYPPVYTYSGGPPHPLPPGAYPPTYAYSGGPPPPPPPPPPQQPTSPSRQAYAIDPAVASTWSGQPEGEIIKTLSGDSYENQQKEDGGVSNPSPSLHKPMVGVKPDIVKRATSNQNETEETKPDWMGGVVKRAALNRDSSRASNRLKELCFPGEFKNGQFDVMKEVHELSEDMGRSKLAPDNVAMPALAERVSTLDLLPPIQGSTSEDSAPPPTKPSSFAIQDRVTTMDAIAASLVSEDGMVDAELFRVESVGLGRTESIGMELLRPGALGLSDRLTTTDLMEMVNAPIQDDDPELISGRRQALE